MSAVPGAPAGVAVSAARGVLDLRWLGRLPYGPTLDAQRIHRAEVGAGRAPESLWLLEHDPVITVGRRGAPVDTAAAHGAGYEVFATERGGLATCHEPGQLVGYVFVDVRRYGVRDLVCRLEGALIGWLGPAGVSAERRPGLPGVWVAGSDPPAKIGALGLHVGGGHSMHGFALNLVNDRRGFGLITPCGIEGAVVASVASVRAAAGDPVGTALRPERVAQAVGERVAAALDLTPGAIFDSPVPAEGT